MFSSFSFLVLIIPIISSIYQKAKMKTKKKTVQKETKEEDSKLPQCILPIPEGLRLTVSAKPNSKVSKIMEINE